MSCISNYLGDECTGQTSCMASHHHQEKESDLRQGLYSGMTLDMLLFLFFFSKSSNRASVYMIDCSAERHEYLGDTECICCGKISKRGKIRESRTHLILCYKG